jgi:hypothetical protein
MADVQQPSAPPATAVVSEALNNASSSATAAASSAASSVKSAVSSVTDYFQSGSVIVFLVLGIAVAFLTAYILYYIISKTISNRLSYVIPKTKVPVLATQESSFPADLVPASGNGKRQTLTFWIYIYDIQKYAGVFRHVLHRGIEGGNPTTGTVGPYIYLDPNTNKMYVTFAPTDVTKLYPSAAIQTAMTASTVSQADQYAYLNYARGITIDYVPLQRWVHVAIVVNEDASVGGSIATYVDGAFVKSVSTNNPAVASSSPPFSTASTVAQPAFSISDANLDLKGNVYTGGSIGSTVGPGFSGMLSMIKFFNYDMNANDIYADYKKGPIDNVLAQLGLPAYGLQSPIYRVG